MAGEVGPQSQPDPCFPPGELHHQETGQLMVRFLVGGKVPLPPFRWVQQLGQVIRVGVGVVKGVLARVPPRGDRVCVHCRHGPMVNSGTVTLSSLRAWVGAKPLPSVPSCRHAFAGSATKIWARRISPIVR